MAKILLTIGPTRVYVDEVRVLSNISSGRLGYSLSVLLSEHFDISIWAARGLGFNWPKDPVEFFTYWELRDLILTCNQHFDFVIHLAAVSDYAPTEVFPGKISSTKKGSITITLKPLEKLWTFLSPICDNLVLFKLEPELDLAVKKAKSLLDRDEKIKFVVANSVSEEAGYRGCIVCRDSISKCYNSRDSMAKAIVCAINYIVGG